MDRCELWAWKLVLCRIRFLLLGQKNMSAARVYVFRVAWELEARASKISLLCFDSVLKIMAS